MKNDDRILGGWTPEDIKELLETGEYLEAFLSIFNKVQWQLRALIYIRFFPKYKDKSRQELWDLLEARMINRFETLKQICVKFDLVKDNKLRQDLDEFNKFRNDIVHKLSEAKVTVKMLKEKCYLGLELIDKIEKIKNELSLNVFRGE